MTLVLVAAAGAGGAADRVEIVLDNSAAMWQSLGTGKPRLVAVRQALDQIAVTARRYRESPEIGLRIVGGRTDGWSESPCENTELVVPVGPIDSEALRKGTANLHPGGKRPLVRAIVSAAADLGDSSRSRRLVIITAGGDQCFEDIAGAITELTGGEDTIEVRIVGLGLDSETANAATLITPTRNANDAMALLDGIEWAVFSGASDDRSERVLELRLTRGGEPVGDGEIDLRHQMRDEPHSAAIDGGKARFRLPPGGYQANFFNPGGESTELANIWHGPTEEIFELDLPEIPPVTLSPDPESPPAGGSVYVQYWGAPSGTNWVELAIADAPFGDYLIRRPAGEGSGEVELEIPGSEASMEARFVHQLNRGVVLLLGRTRFESKLGTASITAPERVENDTPLQLSWEGPSLPGDHITINRTDRGQDDTENCVPAVDAGSLTLEAPAAAGSYRIRYVTAFGKTLASRTLEVFEILATLDSPDRASPREVIEVGWWGPDGPQDFLSIVSPDAANETYLAWAPTHDGNPAKLRTPGTPGDFEIRYVRSEDGEILARQPITVAAESVSISAPKSVEAGTRFEVEWTGTPGAGDFLAVAVEGSKVRRYLDWSYTTVGSPLTLAAPFNRGRFEVRYISGSDFAILARSSIEVR
jgi:Ca-activated chloride channel family protein